MADIMAILLAHIAKHTSPVHVEMPHDFDLKTLPAVNLSEVGPAQNRSGMNVIGVDYLDIDVDVFVTVSMWSAGYAARLTDALRSHLFAMPPTQGVRVIRVGRPGKRPDRNQNIRRLGMTVTVAVPVTT